MGVFDDVFSDDDFDTFSSRAEKLCRDAELALERGDLETCEILANRLLREAKSENHPRADDSIHSAHRLLGLALLRKGCTNAASRHLVLSAKVGPSASLATFGPNMQLAQELLSLCETAAVHEISSYRMKMNSLTFIST